MPGDRPSIGTVIALKMAMDPKNTSATWMQEANHALKHLQNLGLKFFPQSSGLEDDYRIMIPSQEIRLQSQVAKISPAQYSQTMSHYDLFIHVVTFAVNSESEEELDLTHELLQELNRRDPLNTLRTKREMLHLFKLAQSCETRERFAL